MISGLLGKIVGPRVFIAVVVIGLGSIGTLGWLLLESKESQGEAEANERLAVGANQVWQKAWAKQQSDLFAQLERLDAIDRRLAASANESRQRLNALSRGLDNAVQASEEVRAWANRRRPQPVLDRLCLAGYIDPAARETVCGDTGTPAD